MQKKILLFLRNRSICLTFREFLIKFQCEICFLLQTKDHLAERNSSVYWIDIWCLKRFEMIYLLPPYSSALIVQQSTRLMQCNEHLMFQNKTWTLLTFVFMGMTLGTRHAVASSGFLQHQGST